MTLLPGILAGAGLVGDAASPGDPIEISTVKGAVFIQPDQDLSFVSAVKGAVFMKPS